MKSKGYKIKCKRKEVYLIQTDLVALRGVVIQNDAGNYHSPTTIIYLIDCKYITTIDKARLITKTGELSEEEMKEIEIEMNKTLFGVAI